MSARRKTAPFLLLAVLLIVAIFLLIARSCARRPPILLKTATGAEVSEFQMHDAVVVDAVRLEPHTGYTVRIVDADGSVVTSSVLSTDRHGRIPETVLWYDVGVRPCHETAEPLSTGVLSTTAIYDAETLGRSYSVQFVRGEALERQLGFQVAAAAIRPTLYPVDSRGCPKPWYLVGEEDIHVVGKNFPAGSVIRLWAVADQWEWQEGDDLEDVTRRHGTTLPALFELTGDETSFRRLLWPKELTSVGAYDIVAEIISYPFGTYRSSAAASARNLVNGGMVSAFVVQRRQEAGEPLETDLSAIRQSPLSHGDHFLTTEDVYVILNSSIYAQYVGQTADFHVVPDQTEAGWVGDPSLTGKDQTTVVETVQVWTCTNFFAKVWSAPLTAGTYDVVMDFDQNGGYDSATDLIDSLDAVGFTVHATVPQPVVQPVCTADSHVEVCTTINGSTVRLYRNGGEIAHTAGNGGCVQLPAPSGGFSVGDSITARQFHSAGNSPLSASVTVTAGGRPAYDPTVWNQPAHQSSNNCYNYGCDLMTDTYAQPGEAHGVYPAATTCSEVGKAAEADFLATSLNEICTSCSHLVALVIDPISPVTDYHWYRLDANGMWSHKPGSGAATNLDASNNPISDPETADRTFSTNLDYTIFCGYYCVDKSVVSIQ